MLAANLLSFAILSHLFADFLCQGNWIAQNKNNWRHRAAWVHAWAHAAIQSWIFGLWGSILIGLIHLWIDTRQPLTLWAKVFSAPPTDTVVGSQVAIWRDQTLHFLVLGVYCAYLGFPGFHIQTAMVAMTVFVAVPIVVWLYGRKG